MPATIEDVRDAVGRLRANGEKLTNQTVRNILGGGSFEKIAPLLRQALDEEAQVEASLRQAPAALRAKFEGCLASLWSAAHERAREEAENIRSAAEADAKEARGKAEACAAEAEALKAKLLEATLRLTDRTAELEAARQAERAALLSATDASRRAAALETALRAAKAHADDLEDKLRQGNLRIDELIARIPPVLGNDEGDGAHPPPFQPILP